MVSGVAELAELLADAVSVGLLVTAPDGHTLWSNQALRDLVGGDGEVDPAGLPLDGPGEVQYQGADGVARWLQVKSRALPGGEALLHEIADVTVQHEREEQARRSEHRLARVEALARVGSWEWDLATDAVIWSDELLKMFGYPPGTKLEYYDYRGLLHPEDVGYIERTLAEALEKIAPFIYTHRMYLPDGVTQRVFECYGEVLTDDDGRPARILGKAHDITDERRVQAELTYLAEHDPLTSLPNRRSILRRLQERLQDGVASGALLFVDIDNFKQINDLHGHVVGDLVLRGLAPLLLRWSDSRALLGRLGGGDEFAIVLPEGDAAEALAVAESLCGDVAQHPFVVEGIALRITCSIGVAPMSGVREPEVLVAHADLALYSAKGSGKNCAELFDAEQESRGAQRVSVLQRVAAALDGGDLKLYAQPVVDLDSLVPQGWELLVRLRDGIDPWLGPDEFMPAVERTDLAVRLDRWVVEQALELLATPKARREGMRLEVNLSSRTLEDPTFGDWVVNALYDADVEPVRLGLEVCENAVISNLDAARRLAATFAGAGGRLTLDDFGAGVGSFVYLKHVPFTAVKIAGELVRHADSTATDTVLIESVVRAAQGLGMRTIASHIDRSTVLETMQQIGVERGQGFHMGSPFPVSEFTRRLAG